MARVRMNARGSSRAHTFTAFIAAHMVSRASSRARLLISTHSRAHKYTHVRARARSHCSHTQEQLEHCPSVATCSRSRALTATTRPRPHTLTCKPPLSLPVALLRCCARGKQAIKVLAGTCGCARGADDTHAAAFFWR